MTTIKLKVLEIALDKYLGLKNDIDKSEYWETDRNRADSEITDFLYWLEAGQPNNKLLSEKEVMEALHKKNSK